MLIVLIFVNFNEHIIRSNLFARDSCDFRDCAINFSLNLVVHFHGFKYG